jgi:predicted nucleic acid-binding protein
VKRSAERYVLDTQLFINAFRDAGANHALAGFHFRFAPFEQLSAIVAQELRAGVRTVKDRRSLERHVLAIFERTGRVITPSTDAWHRSGNVLAALAQEEGMELAKVSKAFANDILLAISCRESGCVLITENVRDFTRIRKFTEFDFVKPWPA